MLSFMDISNMGQRQNRKRVRHRPNRSRKHSEDRMQPLPVPTSQLYPTAMSVRYSYAPPIPQIKQTTPADPQLHAAQKKSIPSKRPNCIQEDPMSRDFRVFGGLPDDQLEASDLRGRMLDVVLGLFDGIDYDDEKC